MEPCWVTEEKVWYLISFKFLLQIYVKNVNLVYGAGIWTQDLQKHSNKGF